MVMVVVMMMMIVLKSYFLLLTGTHLDFFPIKYNVDYWLKEISIPILNKFQFFREWLLNSIKCQFIERIIE